MIDLSKLPITTFNALLIQVQPSHLLMLQY